jgi:hypothetical protein
VGHLADALQLARTADLDGALVDLELRSEMAFAAVILLRKRKIPVVLYTGYSHTALPEELSLVPLFQKPFLLERAVEELVLLMKTEDPCEPGTTTHDIRSRNSTGRCAVM